MSDPLAEYLSALDARDEREKAHEEYVNACKLQSGVRDVTESCSDV
jgi:hypothetical protein